MSGMNEIMLPETAAPADPVTGDIVAAAPAGRQKTLLESGQILFHHRADECAGDCCLHGTSAYFSCHYPRAWVSGTPEWPGHLVHECGHAKRHPCAAGIAYADKAFGGPLNMEHDCCGDPGCCSWLEAEFIAREFNPEDDEDDTVDLWGQPDNSILGAVADAADRHNSRLEQLRADLDGMIEWGEKITGIAEKLAVGAKRRGNQVDRLTLELGRVESMFVGSERTAMGAAAAVDDLRNEVEWLHGEVKRALFRSRVAFSLAFGSWATAFLIIVIAIAASGGGK